MKFQNFIGFRRVQDQFLYNFKTRHLLLHTEMAALNVCNLLKINYNYT
jgi:hypothetical protein